MTKEAKVALPFRERGYAIDIPALVVHERYAEHARGLPRTTPRGVENIAAGREITPCHLCFGPPPSEDRPSRRRKSATAEPTEDVVDVESAGDGDAVPESSAFADVYSGLAAALADDSASEDRPE